MLGPIVKVHSFKLRDHLGSLVPQQSHSLSFHLRHFVFILLLPRRSGHLDRQFLCCVYLEVDQRHHPHLIFGHRFYPIRLLAKSQDLKYCSFPKIIGL